MFWYSVDIFLAHEWAILQKQLNRKWAGLGSTSYGPKKQYTALDGVQIIHGKGYFWRMTMRLITNLLWNWASQNYSNCRHQFIIDWRKQYMPQSYY